MKNNILMLIVGILIGAVVTSAGFLMYQRTNRPMMPNGEIPDMMRDNRGGQMPPMGEFGGMPPEEENVEKATKAADVEKGKEVTENQIDLSKYDSNFTITKAGEYTLTGNFKNTVLINADGDVTLILNNVNITNELTAAMANIGKNALTIKLANGTTNTLSDGGSSEYDACLYSAGELTIEGQGTLNVYGNQEEGEGIATETCNININGGKINIECNDDGINAGGDGGTITINDGDIYIKANGDGIDSNKNLIINGGNVYTIGSSVGGDAGIDTDGGFEINGGEVIALGSDMLQSPESNSKQKAVCFNLNNKILNGTKIVLKKGNEEIVSFDAKEDFRTLIISNNKIINGTYTLYQNGEKTNFSVTVK